MCRVTGINSLTEYADKIVKDRKVEATHLVPPLNENAKEEYNLDIPQVLIDQVRIRIFLSENHHFPKNAKKKTTFSKKKTKILIFVMFFFQTALVECLQSAGIETDRLQTGKPYSLTSNDQNGPRHSWVDPSTVQGVTHSLSRISTGDIQSFNDADSVTSSPGAQRKVLTTEFNFDAMKRVLGEPTEATKREHSESQRQLVETFRNANFEDLVRRTKPKHDVIQSRLSDLFNSLAVERQIIGQNEQLKSNQPNKSIYENNFPELFFY